MTISTIIDRLNKWRERREFKRRISKYRQRKLERQLSELTDYGLLDRICGASRD